MKGNYMSNAINGVSHEAHLRNQQTVNFKSKNAQNVENPAENTEPVVKDKGLSSTAKWAIGLGLTALASYSIYAFTKGRVKAPKPTPPTPNPANPVAEIKEMGVKAFRKAGNKLDKGKAILADGTNYTGKITNECKDGSKVVMEYVDGVLQKSTKTTKDGTKIFTKKYQYTSNKTSPKLQRVDINKEGVESFLEIDRGSFGQIIKTKVVVFVLI